jgi:multidrug resistance efflux pump
LAQDGWGTVQDAQQYTSQLQQQTAAVRTTLNSLALVQRQIASLSAQRLSAEASVAQARTQLDQAQVNLGRTRLLSPVDGYVTNLLAQLGDYVNVGKALSRLLVSGAKPRASRLNRLSAATDEVWEVRNDR